LTKDKVAEEVLNHEKDEHVGLESQKALNEQMKTESLELTFHTTSMRVKVSLSVARTSIEVPLNISKVTPIIVAEVKS
jgi:hypothetical protein